MEPAFSFEASVSQPPPLNEQCPYTPLDKNSRDIRVASLLPGFWDDPISCVLSAVSIDDPNVAYEAYEALSYVWAQEPGTRAVALNGRQFYVTTNLFLALRRLRKRHDVRVIWVDALCIDQVDDTEKSHQVGMMGDIYRNCLRVFAWLGDYRNDPENFRDIMTIHESVDFPWLGDNLSEDNHDQGRAAFKFIHDMSQGKHFDELGIHSHPRKYTAFCLLVKLPW